MKQVIRFGATLGFLANAHAQTTNPSVLKLTGSVSTITSPRDLADYGDLPTGALTYPSYWAQTLSILTSRTTATGAGNILSFKSISSDSTRTALFPIVGRATSTTNPSDSSRTTTSSARPTNTQPCNNYVEFCDRKYSNITEVAAHNSPFVRKRNIASNQELDVLSQLNDGIRMRECRLCAAILPWSNSLKCRCRRIT
jgi:hypothetical protein